MRYYILEQDKGYKELPKLINWFEQLTASNTKKPDINNIRNREIFKIEPNENTSYLDMLFFPFFMVTDKIRECLQLYEPNIKFKEIILLDRKNKKMQNYFIPSVTELDCLTANSEYTFGHVDLKYIEIEERKAGKKAIFKIKGVEKSYIIARLDVVESLLRRGAKGLMIRKVDVRNDDLCKAEKKCFYKDK